MSTFVALFAAVSLAQAPASEEPASEGITSRFTVHKANVGLGHLTLGTNGGFDLFGDVNGGGTSFTLSANGSLGYFVHDRVLLGGGLGLSLSNSSFLGTSTTTFAIPFSLFGEYWHPLGERLFLFAGLSASVAPYFSSVSRAVWSIGPHAGLAIFLTDWLALAPSVELTFSPDVHFSIGWGLRYFI